MLVFWEIKFIHLSSPWEVPESTDCISSCKRKAGSNISMGRKVNIFISMDSLGCLCTWPLSTSLLRICGEDRFSHSVFYSCDLWTVICGVTTITRPQTENCMAQTRQLTISCIWLQKILISHLKSNGNSFDFIPWLFSWQYDSDVVMKFLLINSWFNTPR